MSKSIIYTITICIVLFLHSVLEGQVLNVPQVIQEQTQWCWAGTSCAILQYYGQNLSQCTIAEYTRTHATWHNFGSVNCCTDPSQGCNYWNYNWGYPGSIQDILQNWGVSNYGYGSYLSLSTVQSEIGGGRPFVIRWGWTTGGGHFLVGHGIDGTTVYYMDPWFGEGSKIATYSWVVSGSNHTWTHTNIITTNLNPVPALTSLSPSSAIAGGSGFTLTVYGTNLIPGTVVRWNGTDRPTTIYGSTQAQATISAGDIATAGIETVRVFNPTPGGGTSGGQTFTVNNPLPTLSAITPDSGALGQTLDVVFTGTNYIAGVSSVNVGPGITVNSTTVYGPTQLTANITITDSTTTGDRNFSVTNGTPGGGTSGTQQFTVNNALYTLNIGTVGNGTITKNPDQASYNNGTLVELTATALVGYHFVEWSGDTSGSANPLIVTMDRNKAINAIFSLNTYIITATSGVNGNIHPSGSINVNHGENQNFTIIPNLGYYVDTIFVDGLSIDSTLTYTFTNVIADHTIHASFAIIQYTITASAFGGTITPSGAVAIDYGQDWQFSYGPNTGYHFDSLVVDGLQVNDSISGYTFFNVLTSHTISVYFSPNQQSLSIMSVNGSVIKVPDQETYDYGSLVQLTAVADSGYRFSSWLGDLTGTENPDTIIVDGNKSVTANFVIMQYNIIATSGPHGSITPVDTIVVDYGTNQRFIFIPDDGYMVDDVVIDGISRHDSLEGFTFTNVRSDHSIDVTFVSNFISLQVEHALNWNMISLPVSMEDGLKTSVFPDAVSDAYAYEGTYISKDTLEVGRGYWLKMPSAGEVILAGGRCTKESVKVAEGWNMVGSISEPMIASSIISDPPGIVTSEFFGYGTSYIVMDTIKPGFSYWVKVSQSGILILSSESASLAKLSASLIRIVPTNELPPPPPDEAISVSKELPEQYVLEQSYPNPFNPTTSIRYGVPTESRISLTVYNTLGQVVSVLSEGVQQAGYRQVEWNGIGVSSGVYFYRLEAASLKDPSVTFTQVRKMLLVR